jgi:hypothetical protein
MFIKMVQSICIAMMIITIFVKSNRVMASRDEFLPGLHGVRTKINILKEIQLLTIKILRHNRALKMSNRSLSLK